MKKLVLIDPNKLQLKGNIHMHTTRSDGKLAPEAVSQLYYDAGYKFLMSAAYCPLERISCVDGAFVLNGETWKEVIA